MLHIGDVSLASLSPLSRAERVARDQGQERAVSREAIPRAR